MQRQRLLGLVGHWVGVLPEVFAEARMAEIAAGLNETRFAWHGPADGSGAVYYRIQGPRLLIEFSTERDIAARHYHSVYRNPPNEYGGVAMRSEYLRYGRNRRPSRLLGFVGSCGMSARDAGSASLSASVRKGCFSRYTTCLRSLTEAFVGECWAGDVAAQAFERVPLMGSAARAGMEGESRELSDAGVGRRRVG